MANELNVAARNGIDTIGERKQVVAPPLTFGQAYAEYITSLKRKNASPHTLVLCEKDYRLYASRFEKRPLSEISRSDLRNFHSELEPRGKTAANSALRLMRSVFSFSMKRLDVALPAGSPTVGVEYFKERLQRKTIAAGDLGEFWAALSRVENPIKANFYRDRDFNGAAEERHLARCFGATCMMIGFSFESRR